MDEEFWKTVRTQQQTLGKTGRTGALNVALLFGTAAIALSLIVTPMLAKRQDSQHMAHVQEEFDLITTGSIKSEEQGSKHYTIRRSVLQPTPGAVCVIKGFESGNPC